MKMNKNSNSYTIIYLVVVVAIVGVLLALTSLALKDKQQANADADKMSQILASLHIASTDGNVKQQFDDIITKQMIVNDEGKIVKTIETKSGDKSIFDTDVAAEIKQNASQRQLPVFVATLSDGSTKYVIPLYGAGLWGPIWGYVAVDNDGSTIYGAYFSHSSETPGLGAEIETEQFRNRFNDKHLFKKGNFFPIEVVKSGQKPSNSNADYIDGISGGTITSKGVGAMIDNCLTPYKSFLESLKK